MTIEKHIFIYYKNIFQKINFKITMNLIPND